MFFQDILYKMKNLELSIATQNPIYNIGVAKETPIDFATTKNIFSFRLGLEQSGLCHELTRTQSNLNGNEGHGLINRALFFNFNLQFK